MTESSQESSLSLPKAAKGVVGAIQQLIYSNRALEALPLVDELRRFADSSPLAVALTQGVLLADIAEETDNPDCVRRAISLMTQVDASRLPEAARYQHWYNVGNAHGTAFRLKRIPPGVRRPLDSDLIDAKRAYQRLMGRSALGDLHLKARLYTNYGHLLRRIGRYVEAIESYNEALIQVPDFGMALWGKGKCLWWYSTLVVPPYKSSTLVEAWRLVRRSSEKGVEPGKEQLVSKDLLHLESILQGPPDLKCSHTEHTAGSDIERQYIRFCVENRLYLHPCPSEAHEAYMDPLSVRFPIPGTNEVFQLISEGLAQLKREYVTARFLLFSYKEKAPDVRFVDRGLFLPSQAPCEGTVYLQFLNLAFRSAYSVMDKIAYFLNSHCRLGEKPKGIHFSERLFVRNNDLRAEFSGYDGLELAALYDLCRDFSTDQLLYGLRDLRHRLEHRCLPISRTEMKNQESLARPEGGPSSFQSIMLAEDELYQDTLRLFRTVRAAIFYLYWFVQKTATPPHPKEG